MKLITILTLCLFVGFCEISQAQWANFPAASGNANGYEWEQIRTNWIQLILATSERTKASGVSTGFKVQEIYKVYNGITNKTISWVASGFPIKGVNGGYAVDPNDIYSLQANAYGYCISTDGYIFLRGATFFEDILMYYNSDSTTISTNWFVISTTNRVVGASTVSTNIFTNKFDRPLVGLTMTNLNLTPYSYIDETGVHSATGYPYVTQAQQAALDAQIISLIPSFVATNKATNGTFDSWFSSGTNAFPMWSKTNLFSSLGIGIVTNGDAYFTRYPAMTNQWLLYEVAYTGSWAQNGIGSNALRYYETIKPVAIYNTATNGTNAIGSYNFVISGDVLNISNQSITNDSETITVSSSNTPCTKFWHSITNISCASAGANTNDWLSISYTNSHPVFGDAPFEIYSADLDERWKVLDALRWTFEDNSDSSILGDLVRFTGKQNTNDYSTYAGAKSECEGNPAFTDNSITAPIYYYGLGEIAVSDGHPSSGGGWLTYLGWNNLNDVILPSTVPAYSNLYPNADAYYRATSSSNTYINGIGYCPDTIFDTFGNTAVGSNKFIYSQTSFQINSTNFTTNNVGITGYTGNHIWREEPSTNGPGDVSFSRGYRINGILYLYRWDAGTANKFIFK